MRPSATLTTPLPRSSPAPSNTSATEHIHFAVSSVYGPVRKQLDRYGISAALDPGAYYDTPGEALEAFHATQEATGQ